MRFELFDEPVLIIKSELSNELKTPDAETLEKIESLLEDEIVEVRRQLDSDSKESLDGYIIPFSLHLQTETEVSSVLLESEWRESEGLDDEEDDLDVQNNESYEVSQLMRVLKITYDEPSERRKIFDWLFSSNERFPFVHGFSSNDFLLLPAKSIFQLMGGLRALVTPIGNEN